MINVRAISQQVNPRLSKAFADHRELLAAELYAAIRETETVALDVPRSFAEIEEWDQQVLLTFIDLASHWFATADADAELMFRGWISTEMGLKCLGLEDKSVLQPGVIFGRASERWLQALTATLSADDVAALREALQETVEKLSRPLRKTLRLLFVGDCLKFDIQNALAGPCVDSGIKLVQSENDTRVPAVLRNQLRALDPDAFDLVFFSPYTHEFFPQYLEMIKPKAALWSRRRLDGQLEALMKDVESTLRVLIENTKCPVYVHNTAVTTPLFGGLRGAMKHALGARNRSRVGSFIHKRTMNMLADPAMAGRARLLDEASLLKVASARSLGEVAFHGRIFHPNRIGILLGRRQYFEAVFTAAYLATKKVIVCDLDNTLWDGVIGEGAVTHFADRQNILKRLRNRGVLLSINSKNDAKNVNFSGGALQIGDFVAPRINWSAKTANMAEIVAELNMKVKDFVFIDDRPDELERMRNAFPELIAMDATQPSTWELLDHWGSHISSEMQEDRTQLYHEKAARESFLAAKPGDAGAAEDESAAFADLQIAVKIENVKASGLKRVVELINRTNQFNLCGSRTTLQDEEAGLGVDHWMITAEARDKFGSMGVVGAMRVNRTSDGVQVPIFVLSCRVFGFGIEYALLNAVQQLAKPDDAITALYKETQANAPGRDLYKKAGLLWNGESWQGKVSDLRAAPEWLSVETAVQA